MAGKRHTEETKKKIGEAHRGKLVSEKTRQKMSIARKGKRRSDETKMRISAALRSGNRKNEQERLRKVSGENSHFSKLKERDVMMIRQLYQEKSCTQKELAELFCVTVSCINFIVRYKTWANVKVS